MAPRGGCRKRVLILRSDLLKNKKYVSLFVDSDFADGYSNLWLLHMRK